MIASTTEELENTKWGTLMADEETEKTAKPKVYAGGDVVIDVAAVISAVVCLFFLYFFNLF